MNDLPADLARQLERVQWRGLAVGVAFLVVCVIGAFFSPTQFFRAYLVSYLFFLGLGHGCLVVLMLYHLTGGAWGFLVRRQLEAGMRTLPLLAVLFVPVAVGAAYLYLWAQPDEVAASADLQHKQIYLNLPFFVGRAVLFFVLWLVFVFFLSRWSHLQDRANDPDRARRLARRLNRLSGPGLAIFGITITFAAVDWLMSLQPAFRSTVFGPLFASGEILTGFCVTLIALAWLVSRPPLADMISLDALNDLGSLLFTFLVLWAYLVFFQFMLIWIANLRYDILWYLPRTRGGWYWVAWLLVLLHFAVPFFLLLSRDVKRNPRALAALAGLLLAMHLVFLYYEVLPAFPMEGILDHWMDFLMPFGLGGLWLANYAWDLRRGPALPLHDANRAAAVHLRELDADLLAHGEEVHRA